MRRKHLSESGFSYLAMLIAIAILGVLSAGAIQGGAAIQRRMVEAELLWVGMQFQKALKTYYEATPNGGYPYPKSLGDLLRDARYPMPRRHLRKIFADPLTGLAKWGLVYAPGGGIMGVYSLSHEHPVRVAGFPSELVAFEGKDKYSDWVFSYAPIVPPLTIGTPAWGAP